MVHGLGCKSRRSGISAAPRRWPWQRIALGLSCLLTGVAVGRWSPREDRAIWREGAARTESAASAERPGSFAAACARVRGGVAAVQATFALGVRSGSGFVVHGRKGLLVTARHVIAGTQRIVVDLPDHGSFGADVVGEDPITDVAVLRLVDPPRDLPELELGRSETLRVGDWVVAVGNPYGFAQTVTAGVVSFVGRHLPHSDLRLTNDFLQFSAPVHPGSSGCPVVDAEGLVVGLTTQAADAGQGISFAIPSRTLKWVLDAMDQSADGRVHRAYLGIEFETRRGTDEQGRPLGGARVRSVAAGEPAARAGVETDDVVLSVDDRRIVDSADLHERITRARPGAIVRLTLQRGDQILGPIDIQLQDALLARTAAGS